MKFLVDESLSFRVARLLTQAGHQAVHLSDVGLLAEPDEVVMASAARDGRVLISADTDFGELLALGRHPGPSVALLRRAPRNPERQADLLLSMPEETTRLLEVGAVVVITPGRIRYRLLPIESDDG